MDEGELNNISTLKFLKDLGVRDISKNGNPNPRRMYEVICLRCNKIFEVRTSNFHKAQSCGCYNPQKESKESLIIKLNKRFPEHKLNFDTFNFKEGQHTPLTIECNIHGTLETTANKMLNTSKSPCTFCNAQILNRAPTGDLTSFINRVTKKYGDKFSYHATKFNALAEDVEIFCKEHQALFKINANNFLYSAKVGVLYA